TEAFSLLSKVKAGPYEYLLYRSSVDESNEQAWFLRSYYSVLDDVKQDGYIPFVTNSAGTWGQLNAGVDHQINQSVSFTGSLSIETSFAGNSTNYGGIVGVNIKF
ncbi:autotransporter outer membrane beta-barrel domain-containing protein, partial [Buttiauxella brennerae]|uniref:autotransporter outer membrane beta-barrel domain-containing protein n=1 Tax=Buttiauxella brennerae TaxID=82988 RepID=UPI00286F7268